MSQPIPTPILNTQFPLSNMLQPQLAKNPNKESTLYVGNLPKQLEDTRLFDYFRPYGDLVSCRIMRDIYSGESRGFAFVSFNTIEHAKKALEALNYTVVDGWELRICFERSPSDFKPEGNIFVKNLKDEVQAK